MNKFLIISLLVSILLMWSCNVEYPTTLTSNQVFVNNTKNKIVYAIVTNAGTDTIFSNGNDSNFVTFELHGLTAATRPFGNAYRTLLLYVSSRVLYVLDDTTSYVSKFGFDATKNDSIIIANTKSAYLIGKNYDRTYTDKIRFTDELKQITQKDYTMLDKFKKYYKK